VSEAPQATIDILAPAKLNLGLEVIGRRPDGYHELATIFLAVDVVDRLALRAAADITLTCDDPALVGEDNLVVRAVGALQDATGYSGGARIDLAKSIPAAAGMGGASSDAAAALLAARDLWTVEISRERLLEIAADIGSDVPFFLRGGCALGRGRGEILTPLPIPASLTFVIVAPALAIPNKTASLFARLEPGDFSDGSRVMAQAQRLTMGSALDTGLLGNAFSRPLYARFPELSEIPQLMRRAGAPVAAITGAGPAHYAPVADVEEAQRIA
jgi:4-diphosphocytidyl-2-C-methyl-D-erythritol kinase